MEATHGEYDIWSVDGIDKLSDRLKDAGDNIEDISYILGDYLSFGNTKVAKHVAIFNMGSATDCRNAETKRCQVPFGECYAHKAEYIYPYTLPYRRRQEFLWDCLDADSWAKAFLKIVERKRNDVSTIRFSEAGDFRHNGDIIKVDRIAEIVGKEGIDVYTYSASNDLDWSEAEHFTVNQSNNLSNYGNRLYTAVESVDDIPENEIHCPHEKQKNADKDDPIKCGDCRACITPNGPDVYITLH